MTYFCNNDFSIDSIFVAIEAKVLNTKQTSNSQKVELKGETICQPFISSYRDVFVKGSPQQQIYNAIHPDHEWLKNWAKKPFKHFLNALIFDDFAKNGFLVCKLHTSHLTQSMMSSMTITSKGQPWCKFLFHIVSRI